MVHAGVYRMIPSSGELFNTCFASSIDFADPGPSEPNDPGLWERSVNQLR